MAAPIGLNVLGWDVFWPGPDGGKMLPFSIHSPGLRLPESGKEQEVLNERSFCSLISILSLFPDSRNLDFNYPSLCPYLI